MFNEINKINPTAEFEPSLANLKAKLGAAWMDGDYAAFSAYMKPGATMILADWRIERGVRLLDVACGAGQIAIPAAKTGARVTGVDIASNLIEAARKQAASEGLHVQFDEGDAENLPYPDGAFDVVISLIGAMFAPRPERVASELARVCRSGGRLYMANWTPDGMVGQMFKIVAKHVPPPQGMEPPVLWGDEATVCHRLSNGFTDIKFVRKYYPSWSYPFDVAGVVEYFRTVYGPVKRAFSSLDHAGQQPLRGDLETVFSAHSGTKNGTTVLQAEYLDVSAIRR
ncbi:MAG TPA: class I SAM-dependent methyltransferase [Candidatus Binatia bacterium]|nr:class I SAM-dependent methyltransferase [Candidatus Binatia bacterium]